MLSKLKAFDLRRKTGQTDKKMATIIEISDGTLDTLLQCTVCTETERFIYDVESFADIEDDAEAFDAWYDWVVGEMSDKHKDCAHTVRSYFGRVMAKDGVLLVGGVKVITSSRFKERSDAVKWVRGIRSINGEANIKSCEVLSVI